MFSVRSEKQKKTSRISTILHLVIWGINIAAIILLVLSYISPYVSPKTLWPLALLGLAVPVLAVLNLFFVLYWLLFGKYRFLYSLIALLVGISHFTEYVQIGFKKETDKPGEFSIMSFNCRLFDLYKWTNNLQTRSRIFSFFREERPDVLCLQEFYHSDKGPMRNIDSLKRIMNSPYFHVEYTVTLRKTDHWGIGTFSKFPIINRGRIDFHTPSNNICIYTDILRGKDTLRIYNVHLQSIHFGKSDYKFVEDVLSNTEKTEQVKKSRNIVMKLKQAFVKRTGQVDIIADHIRSCRYPVIVCGDFNDTPVSYTYRTLSENLEDSFQEAGTGFGRTYGGIFPVRIDYILHSPQLASSHFEVYKKDLSDHYPILSSYSLEKKSE